jgi:hypothetical protein
MNLEARKIEFVQEFLKLQSEEAISRLEKILRKEQKSLKRAKIFFFFFSNDSRGIEWAH